MVKRTSRYPVGKLVLQSIEDSQLSPGHFVTAMGYRNPAKGIKALDHHLNCGAYEPIFFERLLSSPFAPRRETFDKALEETVGILQEEQDLYQIQLRKEERAAFRPYIQGVPELSVPTQITLHALYGGTYRFTIELPLAFPCWPRERQYRYARERIVTHYASCEGRTLFMGRLTSYRLFRVYGEKPLLLSVEGNPLGLDSGNPLPEGTVRIGRTTLASEQAAKLLSVRR